jgi:RND superfamily putative drug exporter
MTISTTAGSPSVAPETTTRPARPARNLAASMAGFSARHRFIAIAGWLLFVAATTALLSSIGTVAATDIQYGNGESRRANEMIAAAGFTDRAGEMVLVHSDRLTVDDAAFRAALAAVTTAVRGSGLAENLRSPADGGPDLVSSDRHAALVTFDMAGDADTAGERVGPVVEAVAAAGRAHPSVYVGQAGGASIDAAVGETVNSDLHRLSMLSIPLTLGILIVAFGALLAAYCRWAWR